MPIDPQTAHPHRTCQVRNRAARDPHVPSASVQGMELRASQVGATVSVGLNEVCASHGKDIVLLVASHVGYDCESREFGKCEPLTRAHACPDTRTTAQACTQAQSPSNTQTQPLTDTGHTHTYTCARTHASAAVKVPSLADRQRKLHIQLRQGGRSPGADVGAVPA